MSRDSHVDKVPGFVGFHLLKGPEAEEVVVSRQGAMSGAKTGLKCLTPNIVWSRPYVAVSLIKLFHRKPRLR
jgi:hypothetical protein